jgi:NDP-sugar pyrophosphorylase family protein
MNIVMPMAGEGARFRERGYSFPKPLIPIHAKTMIQVVVESLALEGQYIFLCRGAQLRKYAIEAMLKLFVRDPVIVEVPGLTEGAACTVLLARDRIDNDEELIIANSDQWIRWNPARFFSYMRDKGADGGILTFYSTHPKWSYVKVDAEGLVTEVAEKVPISTHATVGVYYFRQGRAFVSAADEMIRQNIRTNNEFYVCPVYNQLLARGAKVFHYPVEEMWGLGTPEDLEAFVRRKNL